MQHNSAKRINMNEELREMKINPLESNNNNHHHQRISQSQPIRSISIKKKLTSMPFTLKINRTLQ